MSTRSRVRHWLDAHSEAVGDLRSAEIRLAIAIDAVRREATARHADCHELLQEVIAAAGSLAALASDALTWPKVPDFDGELFFRVACQRWLDVATSLNTAEEFTVTDFYQAAQELVVGRNELFRAIDVLATAAGGGGRPAGIAGDDHPRG